MPSNVFRFDEHWDLPHAKISDVYRVLSHGELLPKWWKGVYLVASDLTWTRAQADAAVTVDGGLTWTKYPLNATEDINEIYFRNDDNGYLVAGRKMFITRDAGRTWQETRIYRSGAFGAGSPEFLSIRFSDKKHGYVVGSVLRRSGGDEVVIDSLLMRTEDGGDTWQRITVPTKTENTGAGLSVWHPLTSRR